MKRYGTLLTDEGMFSHEYLYEAPDGDWVRYEDAAACQAAAKAYYAELEELKARVTRAVAVLATPGTWSEFARAALKELRGG